MNWAAPQGTRDTYGAGTDGLAANTTMHHCPRQSVFIFVVAILLNYPWELAQAPLYVGMGDFRVAISHCFVASVGDGFLVLAILGAGWLVFGTWGWFRRPGARGYLLMLAVGLLIALGVEWVAVHLVERWSYTERMPRVPGLDVGVLPIAQMLVRAPGHAEHGFRSKPNTDSDRSRTPIPGRSNTLTG